MAHCGCHHRQGRPEGQARPRKTGRFWQVLKRVLIKRTQNYPFFGTHSGPASSRRTKMALHRPAASLPRVRTLFIGAAAVMVAGVALIAWTILDERRVTWNHAIDTSRNL